MRKNSYVAASKTGVDRAGTPNVSNMSESSELNVMDMKAEILPSLKSEISGIFQAELKSALTAEFGVIKLELQALKTDIASSTAALRADVEKVKTTVSDVEHGLSVCSDEVTSLRDAVKNLEGNVDNLQEKCLDMEGRMRRSNIRILNVAEETGSSSPAAVSKLIKVALKMDKDVLIDRSHRTHQPKRSDGKPRAYYCKGALPSGLR